jgi:hypothetical protein
LGSAACGIDLIVLDQHHIRGPCQHSHCGIGYYTGLMHRIEPEEFGLLAPWSRKQTLEKVAIILGLVIGAWKSVAWYASGNVGDWCFISLC